MFKISGPLSHYFQHVHEQSYIPYVVALSACVGPFTKGKCVRVSKDSSGKGNIVAINSVIIFIMILLKIFL